MNAPAGLNPDKPITQYAQDVWGADAGLNNNSVTSIAQTPDGYLWLGTEEGLARFDGIRFTLFNRQNTPSIKSNQISSLLLDSKNNLWIGTDGGGLTCLSAGTFRTYSSSEGLASDAILSLYEDSKGILWVGTNGAGLYRFQNRRFQKYRYPQSGERGSGKDLEDTAVYSISGGNDGSLWLGTHSGLVALSGGRFVRYTMKDGLGDDYIKAVQVNSSGDVWAGTNGGGVSHLVNGHIDTYTIRDGLPSNSVWSLYRDSGETIWVGTIDGGLSRIHRGQVSAYRSADGLPSNRILSFFEDREGELWIGTGGAGLARLKDGPFSTLTTREGLSDDVVLPVYQDRQGTVWAGTNGKGLNRIQDERITKFNTRNGLLDDVIFSLAEDKEGSLWIATRKGLNRLKNGRFSQFDTQQGLPTNIVLALYYDHDGTLWAGSRGGLSRFDGFRFQTYTTADGLSNNYVTSIYRDAGKTLWVGTGGGGLNQFRNGRFKSYSTRNGLSSNVIRSISGDADGTLWVGTAGGGLNRLKSGAFTTYTTGEGLFDDDLFQILSDRQGFLWMSSNKGVFRVAKQQLSEYAEGRLRVIESEAFGLSDGLKNKECNGGFQPAGWQSRDGRLLFPTMRGLAIVDPARLQKNTLPPSVVVETTSIDGESFNPSASIVAKPGKGQLEFAFTALSLVSPDKIRFKYKLEGFDRSWVDAATRRTAFYTNIPPGKYRFSVIACNNDGVWNMTGASLPVTLSPHFYETRLFLFACVAAVVALSFGAFRLRISHLVANERRLLLLVSERTNELRQEVAAKEQARTELAAAQQHLMELSRLSGMAEVASGVLHNVGNVLNSVNVAADLVAGKVRDFRTQNLRAAVELLNSHADRLAAFLETDPKGQRILPYLINVCAQIDREREYLLDEIGTLKHHIDHIKQIVFTQQDYAKVSIMTEKVFIPKIIDDAVKLVEVSLERHQVEITREIEDIPEIFTVRHKLLEILVNLLRNAKQAVVQQAGPERRIRICVKRPAGGRIRIEVRDTGIGIPRESLTSIFAHGFTTKADGHGFGLHSGALAARQMGGLLWAESEGTGCGATFILELPMNHDLPIHDSAVNEKTASRELNVA